MAFLSPEPVTIYLSSAEMSQLRTEDDSLDCEDKHIKSHLYVFTLCSRIMSNLLCAASYKQIIQEDTAQRALEVITLRNYGHYASIFYDGTETTLCFTPSSFFKNQKTPEFTPTVRLLIVDVCLCT